MWEYTYTDADLPTPVADCDLGLLSSVINDCVDLVIPLINVGREPDGTLRIRFEDELEEAEKTALDGDTTPCGGLLGDAENLFDLVAYQLAKCSEISAYSPIVMDLGGFEYDGITFPYSPDAREQYLMFASMLAALPFPDVYVDRKNEAEGAPYQLVDAAAMQAFLGTAMTYAGTVVGGGDVLKAQVREATTKAEVDAVVDDR